MGDTLLKRPRDIEEEENANPKRHKNCNDDDGQIIRSLLEADEDEPQHQDLSSFMTSLEQELYSDHHQFNTTFFTASSSDIENPTSSANSTILDNDRDSVIRHLLEASDDELGIPNRVVGEEDENRSNNDKENNNGGDSSSVCSMSLVVEGLWELEDEAANYYTLLQSELFL